MRIVSIEIFVFPLEDAHFGYGIQQGNILPSLPYIPGRAVRGALAGWAIRNGCVENNKHKQFEGFFLPSDIAGSEISFPNCYHRGSRPAPFSLFEVKGRPGNPRTGLVTEPSKPYPQEDLSKIPSDQKVVVDFLRREQWPSDISTETLEPFRGAVDSLGRLISSPPLILDLKAHHDETLGRVGKDGLFAEEAVPCAPQRKSWRNVYRGFLRFAEVEGVEGVFQPLLDNAFNDVRDECPVPLDDPDPRHLMFLGHRRVPAVVYGIKKKLVNTDLDPLSNFGVGPQDQELTLSFISDLVSPSFPLTADMLNGYLKGAKLVKKRVYSKRGVAYGYNTVKHEEIAPRAVLSGGTSGRFKGGLDDQQARTLWALSLMGMGAGNRDGFGRFLVNWDLHTITV